MTVHIQDTARQVVPRWRSSKQASALSDLAPLTRRTTSLQGYTAIDNLLVDWRMNRSVPFAADLVGNSLLEGSKPEIVDAAEYLLRQKNGVSKVVRRVALAALRRDPTDTDSESDDYSAHDAKTQAGKRIRNLRRRLSHYPKNSLAWADLALEYSKLGNPARARLAIVTATSLAPENRHVLRSAARFYVHTHEPDRALHLLKRSQNITEDPWLLAAEISIAESAKVSSRFAKVGRRLLQSNEFSARHTSELASSLATLEATYGANRKARQLFEASLLDPTENSLAQAEWASRTFKIINVQPDLLHRPGTFEANAGAHMMAGKWDSALAESWNWLTDQPFSHKPAVFGSYIASVALEDHDKAIQIIQSGLLANPENWTLRNNLVFAYASQSRVDAARSHFEQLAEPNESEIQRRAVWLATSGLVKFREGNVQQGRDLYLSALAILEGKGFPRTEALATVFLAREETLAQSPEAGQATQRANDLIKKVIAPETHRLMSTLAAPKGR